MLLIVADANEVDYIVVAVYLVSGQVASLLLLVADFFSSIKAYFTR